MTPKVLFLKVISHYLSNAGSAEYTPTPQLLEIARIVTASKPDEVSLDNICIGMSSAVSDEVMHMLGDYYSYYLSSTDESSTIILEFSQRYCPALHKDLTEGNYLTKYIEERMS